jgi:hypothetical protein
LVRLNWTGGSPRNSRCPYRPTGVACCGERPRLAQSGPETLPPGGTGPDSFVATVRSRAGPRRDHTRTASHALHGTYEPAWLSEIGFFPSAVLFRAGKRRSPRNQGFRAVVQPRPRSASAHHRPQQLVFAAAVRIRAEGYTGDIAPFLAFLEQTDMNDDQVVCVKDIPDNPENPPWAHIYVDNTRRRRPSCSS